MSLVSLSVSIIHLCEVGKSSSRGGKVREVEACWEGHSPTWPEALEERDKVVLGRTPDSGSLACGSRYWA